MMRPLDPHPATSFVSRPAPTRSIWNSLVDGMAAACECWQTRAMLSPGLAAWRSRGRSLQVCGHEVFTVDEPPAEAAEAGTPIVILHGYPTSSLDFRHALPILGARRRVVVHDHLGFGLSAKPDRYGYTLVD